MDRNSKIISRKDAIEAGLKQYFTGTPCKHGHIAKRYPLTGYCSVCSSLEHREKYARDPESF